MLSADQDTRRCRQSWSLNPERGMSHVCYAPTLFRIYCWGNGYFRGRLDGGPGGRTTTVPPPPPRTLQSANQSEVGDGDRSGEVRRLRRLYQSLQRDAFRTAAAGMDSCLRDYRQPGCGFLLLAAALHAVR